MQRHRGCQCPWQSNNRRQWRPVRCQEVRHLLRTEEQPRADADAAEAEPDAEAVPPPAGARRGRGVRVRRCPRVGVRFQRFRVNDDRYKQQSMQFFGLSTHYSTWATDQAPNTEQSDRQAPLRGDH